MKGEKTCSSESPLVLVLLLIARQSGEKCEVFKCYKRNQMQITLDSRTDNWTGCRKIHKDNRTGWCLIRSVIIGVITKVGRLRNGSPYSLITTIITYRIGQHEVVLPINQSNNKM